MVLHVLKDRTDSLNLIDIANNFVSKSERRLIVTSSTIDIFFKITKFSKILSKLTLFSKILSKFDKIFENFRKKCQFRKYFRKFCNFEKSVMVDEVNISTTLGFGCCF